MRGYDSWLEPPESDECCEAEECLELEDDETEPRCRCENHYCSGCGLQCNCRCDADYDAWAGK